MATIYMCDICKKAIGSGSRTYSLRSERIKGPVPRHPVGYSYDICESCYQGIKKHIDSMIKPIHI